ncbi:MAG: DUF11 domain-containing protein [Deltaproteobacteria bacterium]|nr:MAG: DUF11 domain-containing protein [Deltaproteobacteria bacterium]
MNKPRLLFILPEAGTAAAGVLTLLALLLCLLVPARSVHAFGDNQCAGSRFGENLVCTAGDVSITGIAVAPGSPTSCVGGSTFTVDLDITVNFSTPDRWDIGIFLAHDGRDPQLLQTSGGATSCSVGILPTASPFLDLDPNGGLDTCGDGNGAINGGTGSGVVRFYDVPVACQAVNFSNGKLFIPFVVSWDNQGSPTGADCTSIADPVPNTKSKCNAPNTAVETEVQYGTVNAVVLPAISKTDGLAAINPGDPVSYTVVITNTTGQPLSNAVFTDPAALNLTATGVSCSTTSGGATCPAPATVTVAAMQGAGIIIPPMPVNSSVTFTVNTIVADPVAPGSATITNTARVTVTGETNSASDTDAIIGAVYSDLSTSTKTVVDLNGGEADPGDVLRYTITLRETSGNPSYGVTVTDHIPANVTNFTVRSIPPGATDSSTPFPSGSNGTGYLNVGNITVPASGSVAVVFDVTVAIGTPAGTQINNIATVANPGGPGGNPPAPPVPVSPSAVPVTANKTLYLDGGTASPYTMSRTPPGGAPASVAIAANSTATWNGNNPVALQLNNTIASATTTLYLTAADKNNRTLQARLFCSNTPTAYAYAEYTYGDMDVTTGPYNFNLTSLAGGFTFPHTCSATNYWVLQIENKTNRAVSLLPISGGNYSRVNLNSSNIIYVNAPAFYNAAYPGGTAGAAFTPGQTVYIRVTVSDPFGSFDISGASIDITNPGGTLVVNAGAMTQVAAAGAVKTYEYAYPVSPFASQGNWTVRIVAREGTEGAVSDDRISAFRVVAPLLTFLKLSQVESDPVNGPANPQAIPGADIRYTLLVTNSGEGPVDGNSLVIVDPIPANTRLFVEDLGQGSPILFGDVDGDSGFAPPQPFTLSYSHKSSCNDYSYIPVSVGGYDANVCRLRAQMTGTLAGATGATLPDFDLTFQVRLND